MLFDRWLWCPEHGAFSPELERIELDEEKMALIESSLRARDLCIDFMSKLKPKLEEEKRFLFLKAPPWSVNVMEGRGGSIYMYASKAGASMTRPAIWGIPMAFFLMVTWNSGIVAKDDFKRLQKLIFDQYGTLENAANLAIVFAPSMITLEKLLPITLICGLVGCNVDSILGGSLRFLSKEEVNILGTFAGAGVALALTLTLFT